MTSLLDARTEPTCGGPLILSDGTELTWDEAFAEFAPAVAAFARSRGIRDPEDLVQDVFVAAVDRSAEFEGDLAGLRSLLFTIAFRRIADEHRRWYRRRETLVPEHNPRPDPGPTVEEMVDGGETTREAMEAFSMLSERERSVLHLRIFEDATPSAVGKALGLSSGNVRVIQARALVKIRTHMRRLSGEGFPKIAIGVPFEFVRHLRAKLPDDAVVGDWLSETRSVTLYSEATAALAHSAGSSVTVGLAVSGIARLGVVVSVVAVSAGGTVPSSPSAPDIASPVEAVVSESEASGEVLPVPVGDIREPNHAVASNASLDVPTTTPTEPTSATSTPEPALDHATPDAEPDGQEPPLPDRPNPSNEVGVSSGGSGGQEQAAEPADPSFENAPEAPAGTESQPHLGDVVDPLVDDLVVPLVDGVVAPLVEGTVQPLVDDVVDPLVDDVVTPLVENSVELLVDDVVDPVSQEIVEPIVDELAEGVVELVDETESLVRNLLGLP